MEAILLVALILMLTGGLPAWPRSRSWGHYPSIGLAAVFFVILIFVLMGRL